MSEPKVTQYIAERSSVKTLHKTGQELVRLAAAIIGISILLKILFPLSSLATVAKLVGAITWLFVLPGYCIMLPWQKEFELKERVVVGMLAAAGMFAIASYYFGLAGVHISAHTWLFPALTLAVSAGVLFYTQRKAMHSQ